MKQRQEEGFIRELELFLDTEFNDFCKKKLLLMLENYKSNFPVREKEVIRQVTVYEKSNNLIPVTIYKTAGTFERLANDAKDFCEENNVDVNEFIKTKFGRKARHMISAFRKEFCRKAFKKYIISNDMLSKFFSVNHTTITFYLYGTKYVRKTDRKMKVNTEKRKLYTNTTSQA